MKIYIARYGERYGPYTMERIATFLTEGSVTNDDLAWAQGVDGWVKLHDLLDRITDGDLQDHMLPIREEEQSSDDSTESQIKETGGDYTETAVEILPYNPEPASTASTQPRVLDFEDLKKDLSGRFAGEKVRFLASLKVDLQTKIAENGKNNLVLIEKRATGDRYFPPSSSASYCKRLIAFIRRKRYEGNELDVELTAFVVEIVTENFQHLYQSRETEISETIAEAILKNETAARSLVETVVGSSAVSQASALVKQQAAELILGQLRSALHGASIRSIVTGAAKVVLTKPAGMIIIRTLAVNLKFIVAKVLASASFKALLLASMKKFLAGAIIGYFARLLALKFGAAALASKTVILIPVVIGFIAWEISRFSKNLGEKVAKKVTEDMDLHYEKVTVDVFDRLVAEIFSTGIQTIAQDLGRSDLVQDSLASILRQSPTEATLTS